jgi:hypothetical protein
MTGEDFPAAVVAPIGDGFEFVGIEDFLRPTSNICKLRSI